MAGTRTRTVAELEVSPAAYDEIAKKLEAAGHGHRLMDEGLIDMTGLALSKGQAARPQMALNHNLLFWDISEDPYGSKLPPGTKVYVDGEPQQQIAGFDVQEGYVRKYCTGEKGEGHPSHKHLDQTTGRVCELTVRGQVRVTVGE